MTAVPVTGAGANAYFDRDPRPPDDHARLEFVPLVQVPARRAGVRPRREAAGRAARHAGPSTFRRAER